MVNKKVSGGRLLYEQALDFGLVGSRHGRSVAEIALLFLSLFGQDVTVISVLALDLTCAGESKTLLCSGISFHFWHCRKSNLVKLSVQRYELFRRFFALRRFFRGGRMPSSDFCPRNLRMKTEFRTFIGQKLF